MDYTIVLYQYKDDDIKVTIEARFDGDKLIIDGYDIGKRVKEYWGDSDYEYSMTLPALSVDELMMLLSIAPGNKQELLQTLASRYNTNSCFSDIQKLLDQYSIPYESFRWT